MDNSLLTHTDNSIIPGGLDNTKITTEAKYFVNKENLSRKSRKKICLSLHYNPRKKFLYANGAKVYQFEANKSEAKSYPLCFEMISKNFTVGNMKKNGLNGRVHDSFVDYGTIDISDTVDIHQYLGKKSIV